MYKLNPQLVQSVKRIYEKSIKIYGVCSQKFVKCVEGIYKACTNTNLNFIIGAMTVLISSLLILVIAFIPNCSEQRICSWLGVNKKQDIVNQLALALAAIISTWGILAASRRADAIVKQTGEMGKQTGEMGKRLSQELFRDAIKCLGSKAESVRLGGCYALFQQAVREEDRRASIADILCAHIRGTTGAEDYQEKYKLKPSVEIISLIRLLFSKTKEGEKFWAGNKARADLSTGYFCGADFSGLDFKDVNLQDALFNSAKLHGTNFLNVRSSRAQFQGADLWKAQFQGANLWMAQFQGADLRKAQFQGADLRKAQFQGAKLWEAQFQGAKLWEAQFQGANLWMAQFQGAELRKAQFQGAELWEAQFQGAKLREAQFQGANLWMAQFQGAKLRKAQFQGAKLRKAQFQGAKLWEAQFQGAKLWEAQFQGAELGEAQFQGADLREAQFQGAKLWEAQFQGAELGEAQFQGAELWEAQFQGAKLWKAQFQGADLWKAQFQGAELGEAQFQGAYSEMDVSDGITRIKNRANKESTFSNVIFNGGLKRERFDELMKILKGVKITYDADIDLDSFRNTLEEHVDGKVDHNLPDDAISGRYNKQQADKWIKELQSALSR